MREETDNKLEAILKEIKTNKIVSTVTNPSSEMNEIQGTQPSGSKTEKSVGVHASNNESSDSENEDYLLRASKMQELKHPAKPLYCSELDLDETIVSIEDEVDYHS